MPASSAAMGAEPWPRLIALVDMDCFFAQVEQRDDPSLRGQPVAVTNGLTGTCIITSSYEARAYGIKTGMRLKEALQLCPDLIRCPTRPRRYAAISTRIMRALSDITPVMEVYSVDEAFLDLTGCQRLLGTPEQIGHRIKQRVFEVSGLRCSVGLSAGKGTAKFAAKLDKPDGLTVIPPWAIRARLADVPVTELSGIKAGIGGFLNARGAYTCGDVARLPPSVLGDRFGNPGRRLWCICRGEDPEPVCTDTAAAKSLGHGKVMPPNTRDPQIVSIYLLHMTEKVAARLRRHQLEARHYALGLLSDSGWIGGNFRLEAATNDVLPLRRLARRILREHWRGEGVRQVQVIALDPCPAGVADDLFVTPDCRRARLNTAMDAINARYGDFTVAPGLLMGRSDMPDVIAPAWRPEGHRQTIDRDAEQRVRRQLPFLGSI